MSPSPRSRCENVGSHRDRIGIASGCCEHSSMRHVGACLIIASHHAGECARRDLTSRAPRAVRHVPRGAAAADAARARAGGRARAVRRVRRALHPAALPSALTSRLRRGEIAISPESSELIGELSAMVRPRGRRRHCAYRTLAVAPPKVYGRPSAFMLPSSRISGLCTARTPRTTRASHAPRALGCD